ncbi:response regulator receiver modulated GAF sensor protein [Haloferax elongans ATCC BAA-1513]|uniref:Response regulator receiver modulated GAF sensor protein n=1 Tax=Haloferax elongans ATCC BAA-1513 TaxID=1230453 RepID=M0HJJ9_HALEO|nr:GAF domain-containing protein [Haloferax elongans]ELZ84661.1 response regulator receiver modulated GAF sensor protein [Haloferax elongans ATCC BAA-1513]
MSRKILCVDTDDRVGAVADALDSEETMTAVQATTVEEARTALDEQAIVCVVTEYELADGSGLDVVRAIRETAPQTPCILFTDVSPNEVETDSFEEVIIEYVNRGLPDAHDRLAFIADDVINHSAQVGFLKPDDEQERLDALSRYDVDELPVQESFDRLTDLIASHFDAAISFIGLLEEDEENFLACHGGDWDSLTRENTICTHSMLQEDVMVVEDIREDKRFSENQQLSNLGIVSYAGANMTTPDGHVIGQVCLIDHEVRSYSDAQQRELEQFAETAMEILQLRQSLLEARSLEVAQ